MNICLTSARASASTAATADLYTADSVLLPLYGRFVELVVVVVVASGGSLFKVRCPLFDVDCRYEQFSLSDYFPNFNSK